MKNKKTLYVVILIALITSNLGAFVMIDKLQQKLDNTTVSIEKIMQQQELVIKNIEQNIEIQEKIVDDLLYIYDRIEHIY